MLCGSSVDQTFTRQQDHIMMECKLTQRSEDPVSKSRYKVCAGVPIFTGQRYKESFWISSAVTSPTLPGSDEAGGASPLAGVVGAGVVLGSEA
jgi:hypothetical protein